uniref:Putative cytochrome n=1 Tax=Ixodes ricinus TaxID=34613 RepID=A0A090XB60_IXORI
MSFISEKAFFLWDWRWLTTALVFLFSYVVVRFYYKVPKYPKGSFYHYQSWEIYWLSATPMNFTRRPENGPSNTGTRFTLWMGERPMVVINTQKLVKEAFVERRHEFAGRFPSKSG